MNQSIAYMAKAIAHLCVRNNTPIEDFHVDHHITDTEMKEFNKAVVNNLYSILLRLFSDDEKDFQDAVKLLEFEVYQVRDWDDPEENGLFENGLQFVQAIIINNG